jgi:hypothetical protein
MISEKRSGAPVKPAEPSYTIMQSCGEHFHDHGMLTINSTELE